MSGSSVRKRAVLSAEAQAMLARAGGADVRAGELLRAAIDDAFLLPDARLDERTRAAFGVLVSGLVDLIAGELIERAGRLLTTRGEGDLAALLTQDAGSLSERLATAGLLRDEDFAAECLARVRLELLAAAIPVEAAADADAPSLLSRLVQRSDRTVAAAARAVLSGESQRRAFAEGASAADSGLPPVLHARLVWWTAAALRERCVDKAGERQQPIDRAVAEAAVRNIAAHDGADRLETAAMRLAEAIDAQPSELPVLIEETLRDRRLVVFAAIVAHALGLEYPLARELLLDPGGDRLWLALRALDLPRDLIARVGFVMSEADPRRDVEAFADSLDVVTSVDPETAQLALAPLQLHPDYRAALLALDRGARR